MHAKSLPKLLIPSLIVIALGLFTAICIDIKVFGILVIFAVISYPVAKNSYVAETQKSKWYLIILQSFETELIVVTLVYCAQWVFNNSI